LPDQILAQGCLAILSFISKPRTTPEMAADGTESSNEDTANTRDRIKSVAAELYVLRGHDGFSFGSSFPGKIKAVEFPPTETLAGGSRMHPVVESWAMGIPANFTDKELSWSFIRTVSSKDVTLGAARNGNGPVRVSTYADPAFSASQPLAKVEAAALAKARPAFPAFPEAVRAQARFLEEVQLAVLGLKSPEEAVAAIVERVTPLLPA
jgi:ABC-type glycerol-3-phosphate transport system substrate-binding protein